MQLIKSNLRNSILKWWILFLHIVFSFFVFTLNLPQRTCAVSFCSCVFMAFSLTTPAPLLNSGLFIFFPSFLCFVCRFISWSFLLSHSRSEPGSAVTWHFVNVTCRVGVRSRVIKQTVPPSLLCSQARAGPHGGSLLVLGKSWSAGLPIVLLPVTPDPSFALTPPWAEESQRLTEISSERRASSRLSVSVSPHHSHGHLGVFLMPCVMTLWTGMTGYGWHAVPHRVGGGKEKCPSTYACGRTLWLNRVSSPSVWGIVSGPNLSCAGKKCYNTKEYWSMTSNVNQHHEIEQRKTDQSQPLSYSHVYDWLSFTQPLSHSHAYNWLSWPHKRGLSACCF